MQSNGVGRKFFQNPSLESMESQPSLLQPTDSLSSIKPPLVWLFNHIRQEGKSSLYKDDLQKLVGPQVDPGQLDLAFENLDADGDGEVSQEEFIAGFARFWKETPDTPGIEKKYDFSFSPSRFMTGRHHRLPSEEHFEYDGDETGEEEEEVEPNEQFQRTLNVLSSHNKHSMEQLWRSLKQANPELLTDFEEFVAEVASEVEGAQRALDNQRKANKREAMELDSEIESRLSAAQTTLNIQTHLVRQDEKAKLERRLVAKESELYSVRNQLQELESEIAGTQQNRHELEQQCQDLWKEKQELAERLEASERLLQESKREKQQRAMEELQVQQEQQSHQELELLNQKKEYEDEITKLKKELEQYSRRGEGVAIGGAAPEDEEVESLMKQGVARPDLLATHHSYQGDTLMQEIAQKEGMASPLLRKEHMLQPSPFLRTHRAGSMRRARAPAVPASLSRHSALSTSLPNLADVDNLEILAAPNRFSIILPPRDFPSPPPDDEHLGDPLPHPARPFPFDLPHDPSQEDELAEPVEQAESEGSTTEHPLQEDDPFEESCQPLEFIESLSCQPDYVFKILVVGNSYVGKSSYLLRLCNNSFSQRYSSTIGVDFYSKALHVDDKVVSLQLWDTAGQERFQSVTKAYYRGAQGVILMYDIAQEESFIAVKSWINSIQENVEDMPAAMCLVGNKQDLDEMKEREVSTETGETFAKIYGADFIEASAKTGYNVGNSLVLLVRAVKRYYEHEGKGEAKRKVSKPEQLKIEEKKQSESKCCSR